MANLARSSLSKLFNNFCAVSRPPSLQLHVANGPRAAEAKEKERLPAGFRPPRVFSLVLKDVYQPHMKISEVGKLASQRLKSLSSQDIKAQADKIGEERRLKFQQLSQAEKDELLKKNAERLKSRRLFRRRKEIRQRHADTHRPRPPPNQYMLFVKSEFERVRPSGDQGREFVAQSARKWRGMSMAEKKPFKDEAEKLRKEYAEELRVWKEKQPKTAPKSS